MYQSVRLLTKQFLLSVLATGLFLCQTGEAMTPAAISPFDVPDTILVNGNIITSDNDDPAKVSTVQAIAIRSGKIIATGTDVEIRKLAIRETEVMDLAGRTVVPGLIDTHSHLYTTALGFPWARDMNRQLDTVHLEVESIEQAAQFAEGAIKARVKQLNPGEWIFIDMDPSNIAHAAYGNVITRRIVDEWAPNNPVKLGTRASVVLNSKAIEAVEEYLGAKVPDGYWTKGIEVGWSRQYADMGRLTQDAVVVNSKDKYAELVKSVFQVNAQAGVTTHATHAHTKTGYQIGLMLDRAGQMPIRWAWSVGWGHVFNSNPEEFFNRLPDFAGYGSDYLWSLGINMVSMDGGAVAMCTTAEIDPKLKVRERCPTNDGGGELRVRSVNSAFKNGLKVAGHHIAGDRALDYYQDAAENSGLSRDKLHSLRLVTDHCHQVRQDQIERAKRLGQTFSCDTGLEVNEVIVRDYGDEYLARFAPFKSMLNAGLKPIISQFGDEDEVLGKPFQAGLMFLTRRSIDGKIPIGVPEEAIPDRMTMLLMMTRWAAFPMERDHLLGSIEPGKFADLVMLDRDVMKVPLEELKDIIPIMTMVQGKIVFEDPSYRGNTLRFNTQTEAWEKDLKTKSTLWRW
jgi:predicted amidohydrolase YtcJ